MKVIDGLVECYIEDLCGPLSKEDDKQMSEGICIFQSQHVPNGFLPWLPGPFFLPSLPVSL